MKRSPAKTKKQQDYVESRDSQKSSSGIKLAKLPQKAQSAPTLWLDEIFGNNASSLFEDSSSVATIPSTAISATQKTAESKEVAEAIKVRKRIRMRKSLTKANSMMAEAELMENLDHTADDKERLRQVTSTIFGARAASEIPLGKSKKQTTE